MKKTKQQSKNKAPKQAPYSREVMLAPVAKDVRVQTYLRVLPGRKGYPGSMRLQGCDLLSTVKVPPSGTTETAGHVYTELYVNPSEFAGTRLSRFADLYEKFLFTSMKLKFQPCKSSTQDGSIGLAYDRDIDDPTPPPSLQGLRQFCAWYGTKIGRVWDSIELDAKLISPETGFYCDDHGQEDRTSYQGQFYCFCEVPTGLLAGVQIGDLYLEYDIDLFIPSLDEEIPTAAYGNTGSTSITAQDIFRPGAAGIAGAVVDALNSKDVYPPYGLDTNGFSKLYIPEGVHRLTMQAQQNGAGSNTLQPAGGPVMIPREPVQAQGAQPQWASLLNVPSTATGASAVIDWLFNVPKGGIDVQSTTGTYGAPTNLWKMNILQLANVMPAATFTQFAQALVA